MPLNKSELTNNQFLGAVSEGLSGSNQGDYSNLNEFSRVNNCWSLDLTGRTTNFTTETFEAFIPILAFTKNYADVKIPFNSINESGHFYCAAPDQQFSVTLYLSNGICRKSASAAEPSGVNKSFYTNYNTTKVTTNLFYRQMTMSNTERQSIINAPAVFQKELSLRKKYRV